jgi:ethanolamine permease
VIFPVCITGASVVYLIQIRSYLILRTHYPNIKREFTSPFGKPGAYVCGLIWAVTFIGAVAFQGMYLRIIIVLVGYLLLVSIYYLLVSRHSQVVSPEEEAVSAYTCVVE